MNKKPRFIDLMIIFVINNVKNRTMKILVRLSMVAILFLVSCKENKSSDDKNNVAITYSSFGAEITDADVIDSKAMLGKFQNLKKGDTITVKFASKINEVCSKKGCWMKLSLGDDKETMVRFKDYGFFMPLDANAAEVIVNGKAYVTETSVEDLRHYAEDAGKTKEEIAKITEPEITYAFEADGVLMKK